VHPYMYIYDIAIHDIAATLNPRVGAGCSPAIVSP
jgi:hypothetical protein